VFERTPRDVCSTYYYRDFTTSITNTPQTHCYLPRFMEYRLKVTPWTGTTQSRIYTSRSTPALERLDTDPFRSQKQEFKSFAHTLRKDLHFMKRNVSELYEVNLGGTAIGTKICAHEGFAELAVAELGLLTELPLTSPSDFIEASSSTGSFLLFSNIIRRVAVKVSKICNDLRLLASGPRCGFGEIKLPAMAPGSSIMPGKINPVIPEVVNQVCFQVMGTDHVIATASEAAQLQLNVFEPIIAYNLLNNLNLMRNGLDTLRVKVRIGPFPKPNTVCPYMPDTFFYLSQCIDGIAADEKRCAELVNGSIGIVTNLLPVLGYKKATAVAKEALATGVPVSVVALQYLDDATVRKALDPKTMIR
jgi:aspartate ammonia-lyase